MDTNNIPSRDTFKARIKNAGMTPVQDFTDRQFEDIADYLFELATFLLDNFGVRLTLVDDYSPGHGNPTYSISTGGDSTTTDYYSAETARKAAEAARRLAKTTPEASHLFVERYTTGGPANFRVEVSSGGPVNYLPESTSAQPIGSFGFPNQLVYPKTSAPGYAACETFASDKTTPSAQQDVSPISVIILPSGSDIQPAEVLEVLSRAFGFDIEEAGG
jgi:hypothetical protein